VVRCISRYRRAARAEIRLLRVLRDCGSAEHACVRLVDSFEFRWPAAPAAAGRLHTAIVTEHLGRSLYTFMRRNDYRGFELDTVRGLAHGLLRAMVFLRREGVIHADLKPENILLVDDSFDLKPNSPSWLPTAARANAVANLTSTSTSTSTSASTTATTTANTTTTTTTTTTGDYRALRSTEVRVIDFGSAVMAGDRHGLVIQTRQYRAPEVIMRLGWSAEADMWSVACIISELCSGNLLFDTHDDRELTALWEHVLGSSVPSDLVYRAVSAMARTSRPPLASSSSSTPALSLSSSSSSSSPPAPPPNRPRAHESEKDDNDNDDGDDDGNSSVESTRDFAPDELFSATRGRASPLTWHDTASASSRARVTRAPTLAAMFASSCPELHDLLQSMLHYDPARRISPAQALQHPFFAPLR
jgi:serine/threonine protein kinase